MRDYIAEANRFMYDDNYIVEAKVKVNGKDFPTIKQAKEYLKKLGLKNDEIEKKIKLGKQHSTNLNAKDTDDKTKKIAGISYKHATVADMRSPAEKAEKNHSLELLKPSPKSENPKITEIKQKIRDATMAQNRAQHKEDWDANDKISAELRELRKEWKRLESGIDESEQMPAAGSAFGKPKKKKSHIETLKHDKEDLEDSLKIAKTRLKII